jgi:hypothetical protein
MFWLIALGIIGLRYIKAQKQIATMSHGFNSQVFSLFDMVTPAINLAQGNLSFATSLDSQRVNINLEQQVLYTELGEAHAIFDFSSGHYNLLVNQVPIGYVYNPQISYIFKLNNKHVLLLIINVISQQHNSYTALDIGPDSAELVSDFANTQQIANYMFLDACFRHKQPWSDAGCTVSKYCFMFKSLPKPKHDKYYHQLYKVCKNS